MSAHPIPAVIVSATHSGAGKTTATASIIRGLRRLGLQVQPFKLGPDFIDPAYLAEAAGRPTVNLDLWMMGDEGVSRSFRRWSRDADIAVVEAMGALYDGEDGSESGSAAAVAKLLGLPVLVVLDAYGMTRTAGDPARPAGVRSRCANRRLRPQPGRQRRARRDDLRRAY